MPSPDDKIALLKQAIQIADANHDLNWGFELRLELIRDEKDTSRCVDSFPAFSWILDTFDRDPDTFDEKEFLWEYKWMLGSARRNSAISLAQIESIAEDYKMRLQRNGYSLRPYYTAKAHMAFFMGQLTEAKKYIELRDKELRDDMANCRACELDDNIELELRLGNLEKALTVGNEVLSKKVTCAHMPFASYCACVKYFQKDGDLERAHEFFLKAEVDLASLDGDTSQIGEIGTMINFLAEYDREKAWQYFEQYADWNINSEEYVDFLFSSNVLPLLREGGTRSLQLSSSLPWYREDNTYDIAELYAYHLNNAKALAHKFDTRNGTTCFKEELQIINKL